MAHLNIVCVTALSICGAALPHVQVHRDVQQFAGPAPAAVSSLTNAPVTGLNSRLGDIIWRETLAANGIGPHEEPTSQAVLAATEALTTQYKVAKTAGARWIRVVINWAAAEPASPAEPDWTVSDAKVRAARAAGLKVLGLTWGTPAWAVTSDCAQRSAANPTGTDWWLCAPQPNAFASFTGRLAARYNGKRDPWLRVDGWELGNELNCANPGGGVVGTNGYSPTAYARQLKAAYPAMKQQSSAIVLANVSGPCGTDATAGRWNSRDWLLGLYRNQAGRSFDAIAAHPYCYGQDANAHRGPTHSCPLASSPYSEFATMSADFGDDAIPAWGSTSGQPAYASTGRSLRWIMNKYGDAGKAIWMTEFGSPTSGYCNAAGYFEYGSSNSLTCKWLTNANQRRELEQANGWLSVQPRGQFGPLFVFTDQDPHPGAIPGAGSRDQVEYHFGLIDEWGTPKDGGGYEVFLDMGNLAARAAAKEPRLPPVGSGW